MSNLYVLDVTTGAVERITDLEPITVGIWWMAPVFSADAARKVEDGPADSPRFSPDGSQLAYGSDGRISITDVATGRTRRYRDVNGWPEWVDEDTLMLEIGVD